MSFPITDWQFWVATLLVLVGAAFLVRSLAPRRPRGKRTTLTVSAPSKPDP
jgi:hypothetical protein